MGYGGYNITASVSRAKTYYSCHTVEENFSQTHIASEMNPYGVNYREARDSEEHPESYPIIIALDETGSMLNVPQNFVTNLMPKIMKEILSGEVKDPAVCFCGIGDAQNCYEEAPLQVGQFESNDELMEKWLTKIYLEGHGQGNNVESYPLAWYFAARHTVTDSFEKRNKKGCLITIGDESCPGYTPKEAIKKYIGDLCNWDITSSDLLKEVKEKWIVYHIHCDGTRTFKFSETNWKDYLRDHVRISKHKNGDDLVELIPKIITRCYHGDEAVEAGR